MKRSLTSAQSRLIADLINELRRHVAQTTQHEFAARMGVSQAQVSRMLNRATSPTLETFVRAVDAMGYAIKLEPKLSSPSESESETHSGQ